MIHYNGKSEKYDLAVAVGCHSPHLTRTQVRRLKRIERLLRAGKITFKQALEMRK